MWSLGPGGLHHTTKVLGFCTKAISSNIGTPKTARMTSFTLDTCNHPFENPVWGSAVSTPPVHSPMKLDPNQREPLFRRNTNIETSNIPIST